VRDVTAQAYVHSNKLILTSSYTVRDFLDGTYLILPTGRIPTAKDFITIPHWHESCGGVAASNGLKGPGTHLHSGPPVGRDDDLD